MSFMLKEARLSESLDYNGRSIFLITEVVERVFFDYRFGGSRRDALKEELFGSDFSREED